MTPLHLLDTDIFSDLLYEADPPTQGDLISRRIAELAPGQVVVCAVTVAEVMRGMIGLIGQMAKVGKDTVGYAALLRADFGLHRFPIAPYTDAAHVLFGSLPPAVRRVGRPDCQIAAIALTNGYVVVTRNTRHFAQIPSVVREDWTLMGDQ